MRKILLTLFVLVLVLGVVGAVGFTGYRFGYAQGIQATANGDSARPELRPFNNFGPRGMDHFGMDRNFHRGFGMGGFPMGGLGFFSLFRLLVPIAFLGLLAWLAYWLFTRSGWQLTRTARTIETRPDVTETVITEEKEN
jgi:hypothetical protein